MKAILGNWYQGSNGVFQVTEIEDDVIEITLENGDVEPWEIDEWDAAVSDGDISEYVVDVRENEKSDAATDEEDEAMRAYDRFKTITVDMNEADQLITLPNGERARVIMIDRPEGAKVFAPLLAVESGIKSGFTEI